MFLSSLRKVLLRDLEAMEREVVAYPDDEALWNRVDGIGNSGGNLALHVAGNLQHFVGALLGGNGYVRDRKAEFDPTPRPRDHVLEALAAARRAVDETLTDWNDERGAEAFPMELGGRTMSVAQFLTHLATHLAFHLGQVDYHRRILTAEKGEARPVAIPDLFEF